MVAVPPTSPSAILRGYRTGSVPLRGFFAVAGARRGVAASDDRGRTQAPGVETTRGVTPSLAFILFERFCFATISKLFILQLNQMQNILPNFGNTWINYLRPSAISYIFEDVKGERSVDGPQELWG